jgi:hypothetical protein
MLSPFWEGEVEAAIYLGDLLVCGEGRGLEFHFESDLQGHQKAEWVPP